MSLPETINANGGRAVVECLKSERVKYIFGVPGGQTLAIMDALYDAPEIRFITTHDERSAACMADGYARMTGEPGVCLVTTGPGATNLLTGVGGAMRDSSPIVLLTANNRGKDLSRDDAQEADHVALFKSLCKWSLLVTRAERIPEAMREAFRRALSGCPGPVHVDFTREILEEETVEFQPLTPECYRPVNRFRGDAEQIQRAAELLRGAKSPAIWAGRGVLLSRATEQVVRLAETLEAPMISTYNGIGSVPANHRLVFGPKSRHGTRLATRVLSESDLLIVIGNSLNAPSTARWQLELPQQLIQIDVDPNMIGRHYPFAVGIVGDALSVVRDLQVLVDERPASAVCMSHRQQHATDLLAAMQDWKREVFCEEYETAVPIKPQFLIGELQRSLPAGTVIVAGAGNPGIWSNLLQVEEPGTYMKPVGFGNMGFALPAAIAAKLAHPQRCVACIIGDGSLGMCLSEIETAVREEAPVVIVVMNNLGYGNIKQEQLTHYGPRYIGVDFSDIRFAEIARGFGADGKRIEQPGELGRAIEQAAASGRTYLLDVLIDPDENVWTEPF